MRLFTKPLSIALLIVALLGATGFAAGCARYGGPGGLWQRVQAEVAQDAGNEPPHDLLVPTPLSVAPVVALSTPTDTPVHEPGFTSTPTPDRLFTPTPSPTPSSTAAVDATAPTVGEGATATDAGKAALQPAPQNPLTAPPAHALTGIRHEWQTWNNCGPATLAMQMSHFGSPLDQADVGGVLRRHEDDKNVSPQELADFARAQGYEAQVRINGSGDLLRALISAGLPVLIETWHEDEPDNGMGHYRLLTGYEDNTSRWIAYDTFDAENLVNPDGDYRGIYLPYAETDALWQVFHHTYLLVYPPDRAAEVQQILGETGDWAIDEAAMWQQSLLDAQRAVDESPGNAFAHFNLGTSRVATGDFAGAASAYDQARQLGLPWRMLWYQFGSFEAYTAIGRHAETLALAEATLATTEGVEELHYWRGRALAGLGDVEGARGAFERSLALNPDYEAAVEALAGLGG